MASGKYLLLFCVTLNIMALFIFNAAGNYDTPIEALSRIYDFSVDTGTGQIDFTGQFANNVTTARDATFVPNTGIVNSDTWNFIDSIKLVMNFFSFLTPFPLSAILYHLALPTFMFFFICAVVGVLSLVAVLEFWRGGSY